MLRIKDLEVQRAGSTICRVPELNVEPGERVAIVGPNGSGKTTLLRVVGGLEREMQGTCVAGVPLRQRVYLHQTPCLFRGSVMFNVGYGLAARNVPRKERRSAVRHWLDIFQVGGLAARRCNNLSGGERRRVALARSFAIRADLILLDEPFAELDEDGIEIVCRAIAGESEATILMASPVPPPATLSMREYRLQGPTD